MDKIYILISEKNPQLALEATSLQRKFDVQLRRVVDVSQQSVAEVSIERLVSLP